MGIVKKTLYSCFNNVKLIDVLLIDEYLLYISNYRKLIRYKKGVEPSETTDKSTKNGDELSSNTIWWAICEEVRTFLSVSCLDNVNKTFC